MDSHAVDTSRSPRKSPSGFSSMLLGGFLGLLVVTASIGILMYFHIIDLSPINTVAVQNNSDLKKYAPSEDPQVARVDGALHLPMQADSLLESCQVHQAGNPLLKDLSYGSDGNTLLGEYSGNISAFNASQSPTQFQFRLTSPDTKQSHVFTISKDIRMYDNDTYAPQTVDTISSYKTALLSFTCSLTGSENFSYTRLLLIK